MKKKGILLVVCLIVFGAFAVKPTLAAEIGRIFQDVTAYIGEIFGKPVADTEGKLDVQLRYFKADQEKGTLVPTDEKDPGQVMIPATYQDDYRWQTVNVALDGKVYPLFDREKVSGVVDKFVSVENTGEETAFFRMAFAVAKNDTVQNLLHITFSNDRDAFEISDWQDISIDGREWQMIVYTYKHPLKKGQVSPPMLLQAVLQKEADNQDMQTLTNGFLQVKVMSIQADVFTKEEIVDGEPVQVPMSALEALDIAVPLGPGFQPFQK